MLSIDLQNAFEAGHTEDNFTVWLLRLIVKADSINRRKLSREFNIEVLAVNIYTQCCPYKDAALSVVDWEEISRRATEMDHAGL